MIQDRVKKQKHRKGLRNVCKERGQKTSLWVTSNRLLAHLNVKKFTCLKWFITLKRKNHTS